MPRLTGLIKGVLQCVENIDGCAVRTRYPSVPHPNAHGKDEEQELRYMFNSVTYSYEGKPCKGASGHSTKAP